MQNVLHFAKLHCEKLFYLTRLRSLVVGQTLKHCHVRAFGLTDIFWSKSPKPTNQISYKYPIKTLECYKDISSLTAWISSYLWHGLRPGQDRGRQGSVKSPGTSTDLQQQHRDRNMTSLIAHKIHKIKRTPQVVASAVEHTGRWKAPWLLLLVCHCHSVQWTQCMTCSTVVALSMIYSYQSHLWWVIWLVWTCSDVKPP